MGFFGISWAIEGVKWFEEIKTEKKLYYMFSKGESEIQQVVIL
jgi:hypothetical protein